MGKNTFNTNMKNLNIHRVQPKLAAEKILNIK